MKLTVTEAREKFLQLPDKLEEVATITRHGEPVLAVLPWDLYTGILETLEILTDPQLSAAIDRGRQDAQAGRTHSLESVLEELELA